MNWDMSNTTKPIPYHGFCSKEYWQCGRSAHYKWYKRRANAMVHKEMDLPKFLHR